MRLRRFAQNHILTILFIFAVLVRIGITLWSFQYRENTDVLRWRDWGRIAFLYGFADTYKPDHIGFGTLANNLPPGMVYILTAMYWLTIQVAKVLLLVFHADEGILQWINGPLLNFFLRLPSLLCDAVLGYGIYMLTKRYTNHAKGLLAAGIFLFHPAVLYNSAVWGQMDAIINALFLVSVLFVLNKKLVWSALFLALSLSVKFSLIYFLPVMFLAYYKLSKWRGVMIATGVMAFVTWILSLPVSVDPRWYLTYVVGNISGEMQNITAFAFNFWWVVFRPFVAISKPVSLFEYTLVSLEKSPLSSDLFWGVPLFWWAVGSTLLLLTPLLWKFWKTKTFSKNGGEYALILAAIAIVAFLFLPHMHERYLYPAIPWFTIAVVSYPGLLIPYVLLSLLHMINLYIVWHPFPEIAVFPYAVMNSPELQWSVSVAMLCVGVWFYWKALRGIRVKNGNGYQF